MPDTSRLLAALSALVNSLVERVDFYALYPARVVAQNDDGTLEVRPDHPRLPALSRVPIRYGIPGLSIKLVDQARVLMGFEGGSPEAPYVSAWASGAVAEYAIETTAKVTVKSPAVFLGDEDGARPVARVGDPVAGLLSSGTIISGSSAVTGPFVATVTIPSPIYGLIQQGAKKANAA